MENVMTNEERMVRRRALFLGKIYFCIQAGINPVVVLNKMNEDFQILKFGSYNGKILGDAQIFSPTIYLYALKGHTLSLKDFIENIEQYRSTILHEMIHKFFTKKDIEGHVLSVGLEIFVQNNPEFKKYLKSSEIEKRIRKLNFMSALMFKPKIDKNYFGTGANEGFTEWYRYVVLKNEEEMSYSNLAQVFFEIQNGLEKKQKNALVIMKDFANGNYESIFKSLNMSKEVGILFVRMLDYLYVKEYESDIIQEYLKNKKEEKELLRNNRNEQRLKDIRVFCGEVERQFKENYQKLYGIVLSDVGMMNEFWKRLNQNNANAIANFLSNLINQSFSKENLICLNDIENLKYKLMKLMDTDILYYSFKNKLEMLKFNLQSQVDLFKGKKSLKIRKVKKINPKMKKVLIESSFIACYFALSAYLCFKGKDLFDKFLVHHDSMVLDDFNEEYERKEFQNKRFIKKERFVPLINENYEDSLYNQYFSNGIDLVKGQSVYQTSYDLNAVKLNYDYENVYCDSVRVIKNNEILAMGDLKSIDELSYLSEKIDGNLRLRVAKNDTQEFIAWLDFQDIKNMLDSSDSYILSLKK